MVELVNVIEYLPRSGKMNLARPFKAGCPKHFYLFRRVSDDWSDVQSSLTRRPDSLTLFQPRR